METIVNESRIIELQTEALEYTKRVIGRNDWDEIYNLKKELLMREENAACFNQVIMQREKKREKQHQDEVYQLKDQIERLAQLVGKMSKKA